MVHKISIIVPVRNEAGNIRQLIFRIDNSLKNAGVDYRLIFVDDHSTDNTKRIIYNLARIYPIDYLLKKGKPGKAYSIIEGANYASTKYVVMIDGDLQYPPEVIPAMCRLTGQYDVVVANRTTYQSPLFRRFASRLNRFVFGRLLHGINHDIQSGLKLFKRDIIRYIDPSKITAWTIDLPLLYTARELGLKIGKVDIDFKARQKGKSKIDFGKATLSIVGSSIKLKFRIRIPYPIQPSAHDSMLGAGFTYRGNRFITHSTLPHHESAIMTLKRNQQILLISLLAFVLTAFVIKPHETLIAIIAVLSFMYFIDVLFNFFLVLRSLNQPPEITIKESQIAKINDQNLPWYTILCPLYREAKVLPQFVTAITALDWPKDRLDVQLLLEEDDTATIQKAKKMNLPSYIKIMIVPRSAPQTKPKACNYGLAHAKGEYVVIYDAEDIPDTLQLKKAYLAFQKLPQNVVCLQAKLNYYNPHHNLLTRLFTAEYSLWFDVILTGLQSVETSIPLGGTSNHFKMVQLKNLHGWDPFNVTEDCDLGARLFKKGYKTAIIDSTTLEEANSHVGNWIRQRSRWIKGYIQTYFVHMRDPVNFLKTQGIHSLLFQFVVGGKIAFILINPILWITTIAYFSFYAVAGPTIESLYPPLVFYFAATSLIFGNFLCMYYYMIGCAKRGHWSVIKYVFFIPFYWLLVSFAASKSLLQLFFKPYFWEKTVHGFHLNLEDTHERRAMGKVASLRIIYRNIVDFVGIFGTLPVSEPLAGGKLRILVFNWRDLRHKWAGGAEVYIHELAKRWVKMGHEVTLFCGNDSRSARYEMLNGIHIIRRGGFYMVYIWAWLYYRIQLHGHFDVIIDSENGLPFFTPLYAREKVFLLIHHVHQEVFRKSLSPPFSLFASFLEKYVMPWVYRKTECITVSPSSKADILSHKLTHKDPYIVYNGVDLTRYVPAIKNEQPMVLYLGRLTALKSVSMLIKAASTILKQIPDVEFVIAGDGPDKKTLVKLVSTLKLGKHVTFLGRVSERKKLTLYQRAWVFVNPSLIEGWGITTIEANACGTPVVASNVAGLRDAVHNPHSGLLVPYGNATELSKSVSELLHNTRMRNRMSKDAVTWARKFDWKKSAAEGIKILMK